MDQERSTVIGRGRAKQGEVGRRRAWLESGSIPWIGIAWKEDGGVQRAKDVVASVDSHTTADEIAAVSQLRSYYLSKPCSLFLTHDPARKSSDEMIELSFWRFD